jgi:hypothetical protein
MERYTMLLPVEGESSLTVSSAPFHPSLNNHHYGDCLVHVWNMDVPLTDEQKANQSTSEEMTLQECREYLENHKDVFGDDVHDCVGLVVVNNNNQLIEWGQPLHIHTGKYADQDQSDVPQTPSDNATLAEPTPFAPVFSSESFVEQPQETESRSRRSRRHTEDQDTTLNPLE